MNPRTSADGMNGILGWIGELQGSLPERNLLQPLASLHEECGELATEILIKEGYKHRMAGPDGVVGEAVDAILCLLDIIVKEQPGITYTMIHRIMEKKMCKWQDKYTTTGVNK